MNIDEYLKGFTTEQVTEFWEKMKESDRKRDEFMIQYKIEHECCPNCGISSNYITTLASYIYNFELPEQYKDLNICTCGNCGNQHTYHERVSKKIIK